MSRSEDREGIRFTLDGSPQASIQLTSVSVNDVMGKWVADGEASGTKKEVLAWQVMVLRYFLEDWLPENGMVVMKARLGES